MADDPNRPVSNFTDDDLFNCWPGGVSPTPEEIAQFAALEVTGVRDASADEDWTASERERFGTMMESCADSVAEFWSVYGRLRPDSVGIALCECITDGPPGDKAWALELAAHLGRLWNLPVR